MGPFLTRKYFEFFFSRKLSTENGEWRMENGEKKTLRGNVKNALAVRSSRARARALNQ